ncbi:hypothetical protein BGZ83_005328 [Gryganskiella cystojenkinii]|nr:hypothetical protein BGZ83_005328 [Gryganskiella cystojenkinii]
MKEVNPRTPPDNPGVGKSTLHNTLGGSFKAGFSRVKGMSVGNPQEVLCDKRRLLLVDLPGIYDHAEEGGNTIDGNLKMLQDRLNDQTARCVVFFVISPTRQGRIKLGDLAVMKVFLDNLQYGPRIGVIITQVPSNCLAAVQNPRFVTTSLHQVAANPGAIDVNNVLVLRRHEDRFLEDDCQRIRNYILSFEPKQVHILKMQLPRAQTIGPLVLQLPQMESSNPGFGDMLSRLQKRTAVLFNRSAGTESHAEEYHTVVILMETTKTRGIFHLNGSAKSVAELQLIFDAPPNYGSQLDWSGYTVHDVANVLRRYLYHLPVPVIPLEFYEKFRTVYRDMKDQEKMILAYQDLICKLPIPHAWLLMYLLDLLSLFAFYSAENMMDSMNLAVVFQAGILSHPNHAMSQGECMFSAEVLKFLIDRQSHLNLP